MDINPNCSACEHAIQSEDWDEAGIEACGGIGPQRVTYYEYPLDECASEIEPTMDECA